MSVRRVTVLALALSALVSCRPDDQRTDTLDPEEALQKRENLAPAVVAQLDSGSEAYRAGDHAGSLVHYTSATELDANVGAAWFGVYMAQRALGNEEEAVVALERAQRVAPGATLIHPTAADTAR
jgi:hypothetical protein